MGSHAEEMGEPRPFEKGLVEVFTGMGKGKTSAALGIALRAAGHGLRVHIVYFMKGDTRYGEQQAFGRLGTVTYSRFGQATFVDPARVREEEKAEARRALAAGREAMLSGRYDIVILDEVNVASAWGLVNVEEVVALIKERPANVELILTGRYADPRIIAAADLVTEMVELKHPYSSGTPARQGIDY